MSTTITRGARSLRKTTLTKTRIGEKQENPDIVITLNRKHPSTRSEFVIDVLESAGASGLFVNALLRGWNDYREKTGKPKSNYAAFRKLVFSMKQKRIIEKIPDNEVPLNDLKGTAPWKRSFYRLTHEFLESRY
jgi:hypothetical protein